MTWEDYLERNYPTYISNAPASEPTIRMPRQSDYPVDELRQGFNLWKWLAKGAENNPVQRYLDKDETDYLREPTLMDQVRGWYAPNLAEAAATGQGNVGILPEIAGDLAGGIGSLAKAGFAASKGLPALAGLVEMGGKKYPQAYLHRSIEPQELDYLERIISKGASSEKPMSLVVPEYAPLFDREGSLGLIYNADPRSIKGMWPYDAWTVPTKNKSYSNHEEIQRYLNANPGTKEAKDMLEFYADEVLGRQYSDASDRWGDKLTDIYMYLSNLAEVNPHLSYDFNSAFAPYQSKSEKTQYAILSAMDRMNPYKGSQLYNKENILNSVINREKTKQDVIPDWIRNIHTQTWTSGDTRSLDPSQTTIRDYFRAMDNSGHRRGEFISSYGKDNLAGIRISPRNLLEPGEAEMRALDFSEKNKLPLFSWEHEELSRPKEREIIKKLANRKSLGTWETLLFNVPGYGKKNVIQPASRVRE